MGSRRVQMDCSRHKKALLRCVSGRAFSFMWQAPGHPFRFGLFYIEEEATISASSTFLPGNQINA